MNKKQAFMYLATLQQGGDTPSEATWHTIFDGAVTINGYHNFTNAIPDDVTSVKFRVTYDLNGTRGINTDNTDKTFTWNGTYFLANDSVSYDNTQNYLIIFNTNKSDGKFAIKQINRTRFYIWRYEKGYGSSESDYKWPIITKIEAAY